MCSGLSSAPKSKDGKPGDKHGKRAKHEGRAQRRPDADSVPTCPSYKEDCDERDNRFRQRCADCGENRSDHAFRKVKMATEPLDAVGEKTAANEDEH